MSLIQRGRMGKRVEVCGCQGKRERKIIILQVKMAYTLERGADCKLEDSEVLQPFE